MGDLAKQKTLELCHGDKGVHRGNFMAGSVCEHLMRTESQRPDSELR